MLLEVAIAQSALLQSRKSQFLRKFSSLTQPFLNLSPHCSTNSHRFLWIFHRNSYLKNSNYERPCFRLLKIHDLKCNRNTFVQPVRLLRMLRKKEIKEKSKSATETGSEQNSSSGADSNNGSEKKNKNDNDNENNERKRMLFMVLNFSVFSYIVAIFIMRLFDINVTDNVSEREINWNFFVNELLAKGEVREIYVALIADGDKRVGRAAIYLHPGAVVQGVQRSVYDVIPYTMSVPNVGEFEANLRNAEAILGVDPRNGVSLTFHQVSQLIPTIIKMIPLALLAALFFYWKKRITIKPGNLLKSMFKPNIIFVDPHSKAGRFIKIRFDEIAGLHEAKEEVKQFVDYLKRPTVYTNLGAKLPKGALLTGPPGCGKTLLAKAVATESSVPFMSMNGTEFCEVVGGMGASRVRDLFKQARDRAPSIIYIDEIDAIGRRRNAHGDMGIQNSEEEQTLNQLLVEMDGMDSAKGVILLASTNRADILDKALLRRGRFDRHINIDPPTALERLEIFELYLKKIKLDRKPKYYSLNLTKMTPGFTGADINNIVNEAAIRAATSKRKKVTGADLDHALQRVLAGPEKRSHTLSSEEKTIVAFHNCGQALAGWLLQHTDALLKVSIVPRTSSMLGFTQHCPADRKLYTKEELYDRMCMTLGGRAAENVIFGRVSTRSEQELKKVTRLAYDQVKRFGMSEYLGPLSFSPPVGEERVEMFMKKPYSRRLQHLIDQEANALVSKAYFAVEQLLKENIHKLNLLGKELLKKETLDFDDVERLIGPPKFRGQKSYVDAAEQILPEDYREDEVITQSVQNEAEYR